MKEVISGILDALQMSPSELATKLSVQRSTFSHLMSGRNKPSFDFIQSLLKNFPELNPDYVILGIKPILRPDIQSTENETLNHETHAINSSNTESEKPIKASQLSNEDLEESKSIEAELKTDLPQNNADKSNVTNVNVGNYHLKMIVHYYSNGTFEQFYPK